MISWQCQYHRFSVFVQSCALLALSRYVRTSLAKPCGFVTRYILNKNVSTNKYQQEGHVCLFLLKNIVIIIIIITMLLSFCVIWQLKAEANILELSDSASGNEV